MPKKRQLPKEIPEKQPSPEQMQEILAELSKHPNARHDFPQEYPEEPMPDYPEEIEEPDEVEVAPKEHEESLCVEDYINLSPRLKDIQFSRSGELVDLKVLRENIYLQEKKSYVALMLVGLIFFAMGVL